MPDWEGAPAHLVEAIVGVALLIWLSELLGRRQSPLRRDPRRRVGSCWRQRSPSARGSCRGEGVPGFAGFFAGRGGRPRWRSGRKRGRRCAPAPPLPATRGRRSAGSTQRARRGRGRGARVRPLGVDDDGCAGSRRSSTSTRSGTTCRSRWRWRRATRSPGSHYTETVFTNWFYPQNSELLHACRDPAHRARHAQLVPQLRLAGDRLPGRLVHRQALRARAAHGRSRRDPARVPHARRARAGSCQERPDGGGAAARGDRDPRQRLGERREAQSSLPPVGRSPRPGWPSAWRSGPSRRRWRWRRR